MIKSTLRKTIRALPIEDRIDLFEDLGLSIATDDANIPLQKWQEDLFNERIAQYEANPKDTMTLAQFKSKAKTLIRELKNKPRRAAQIMTKVIFLPIAWDDMEVAARWYNDQREEWGATFAAQVVRTLKSIEENPLLFATVHSRRTHHLIRRAMIGQFPYGVYFLQKEDAVVVFAVTHLQRNSRAWTKKIPSS